MIVGIGVDLVDIERFERTIARTPRLTERLFSHAERTLKPRSLAARYAAKEALIKALGGSDGVHWTEIEITSEASGRPWFALSGSTAEAVAEKGITMLHLSMSHDAGLAAAYVVAEAGVAGTGPVGSTTAAAGTSAEAAAEGRTSENRANLGGSAPEGPNFARNSELRAGGAAPQPAAPEAAA